MSEQEISMPRRLRVIFRALSVLTSLEGAFGLLLTAMTMLVFPFVRPTLEDIVAHPYSHSALLLYAMALANVAFDVMLAIASVLLWKLQRRGLFLVVCTLLAEATYLAGITAVQMYFVLRRRSDSAPFSESLGAMSGVGNMSLGVQLATAFPIVAGVLIFFAYRYLGIPARPLH